MGVWAGVGEVHVAQGVYRPDEGVDNPEGSGSRTATFSMAVGVTVAGGYAGLGAPDPDARDIDLYETIFTGNVAGGSGGGGTAWSAGSAASSGTMSPRRSSAASTP